MKPISDLFEGIVVFVSSGTAHKDPNLPLTLAKNGALVVRNVNNKVGYVVCDENDKSAEVQLAQTYDSIKLIREQFFADSLAVKSLRNENAYLVTIESSTGASSSTGLGASTNKKRPAAALPAAAPPPKKKKTKSSSAPAVPRPDPSCPFNNTAHIYEDGSHDFWCCTLNLTDVGNNNNKFYKIELLESNNKPFVYSVWTRWGRVGYEGQSKLFPFKNSLAAAKAEFEKKFRDKTATDWADHADFHAVPGKYTLLDMAVGESSEDDADEDVSTNADAPEPMRGVISTSAAAASTSTSSGLGSGLSVIPTGVGASLLDPRVQDFVEMIFDKKMMANTVASMNYNVKKMPLGKLHKTTIKKAYAILKEVADVLQANPGKKGHPKIVDLSNQFYTYIPHSAGMARLPYIDNDAILKEKLSLLETLLEVEIAEKLKKDEEANVADAHMHPIDRKFKTLGIGLTPLERSDPLFPVLEKYVYNTHASTHNDYTLKVLDIIEVDRPIEAQAFPKCSNSIDNHQLLWHGSRMSNWVGILSQGLRIAPPEAPVTGYMFGKGVYFADISSKSANYCHANDKDPIVRITPERGSDPRRLGNFNNQADKDLDPQTSRSHSKVLITSFFQFQGVLLLCEVALGKTLDRTKADYITSLPSGYHSVCGLGTSEPDPSDFHVTPDKIKIPFGKPIPNPNVDHSELRYNEFIVYDVNQIKMKYLVKLRFNFK